MVVGTVTAAEAATESTLVVEKFGEDTGTGFGVGVTVQALPNRLVMRPLLFIQDGHVITLESNAFPRRRYSFRSVSPTAALVYSPRGRRPDSGNGDPERFPQL